MRKLLFIAALTICPFGSAGAKVFKCVEDGKTIYQKDPCRGSGSEIDVVPANEPLSSGKETATDQSALTAKRNNQARAITLERRVRDIDYEIRNLEADISKYQADMKAEMEVLQQKKEFWKNKLGGSTWEQNTSNEMQSVSESYRLKIQAAQDNLSQLNKEKADINAQLPGLK